MLGRCGPAPWRGQNDAETTRLRDDFAVQGPDRVMLSAVRQQSVSSGSQCEHMRRSGLP